jgi:hypothetical protein
MASRSRYDELHDKYHKVLTTKSGTRYERLAALVFKTLEDKNAIIHDMKLAGEDPEVKHQIDVTIEIEGVPKRKFIECKDFDISGGKVGLDIVRNFRSVVEDAKADEGIILTCNGFTEDAQKYARSKSIKLAVLRLFETRDMDGRIMKIIVGITIQQPSDPKATLYIRQEQQHRYQAELAEIGVTEGVRNTDPVFFVRNGERRPFNEFLTARMNDAIASAGPKIIRIVVPAERWQLQVKGNPPIPFEGIVVNFGVDEERHTIEVASQRIAELILSGFGVSDIIFFGDQIERFAIDPETGAVIHRDATSSPQSKSI